jgi:hypothetical protein
VDVPGYESQWGLKILSSQTETETHPAFCKIEMGTGALSEGGGGWPEFGADLSQPSSSEVVKE